MWPPFQVFRMCAQAWTKKTVSKDDWEKKLAAVKIHKEDMNKLVMNFLVTEASQLQQRLCYEFHFKLACNGSQQAKHCEISKITVRALVSLVVGLC